MDKKEKERKKKMCICKNHGGENIIKRNITFVKKQTMVGKKNSNIDVTPGQSQLADQIQRTATSNPNS